MTVTPATSPIPDVNAKKRCSKCGALLDLSEFGLNRGHKDGRRSECRSCQKAVSKTYEAKLEIRQRRRAYRKSHPEIWRASSRRNANKHPANRAKSREAWRTKNPIARLAHKAVERAIERGELMPMPCEVCGSLRVHAHHDDYTSPLSVRWLCPIHHAQHHTNSGGDARSATRAPRYEDSMTELQEIATAIRELTAE